jgi:hypothetical protein
MTALEVLLTSLLSVITIEMVVAVVIVEVRSKAGRK